MQESVSNLSTEDLFEVMSFGAIDAMLKWQDELSEACGVYAFPNQLQIEMAIGQLVVEAAEAYAPFLVKTKPWKPQSPNMAAVDEEMIDVLHYVLSYFNMRQLKTLDIVAMYRRKNVINFNRIQKKMLELSEE